MDKNEKVNIFIVGSSNEFNQLFIDKINFKSFKKPTFTFGSWEDFFVFIANNSISYLIVDFTDCAVSTQYLRYSRYVMRIRKTDIFSSLPIFAFLKSKEIFYEHSFLTQIGLNYYHIIGDDINLAISNISFIASEDESFVLKLAHAKKLELKAQFQHECYLEKVSLDKTVICSDIVFDETPTITIKDFFEENAFKQELIDQLNISTRSDYFYSFETSFLFSSSWAENDKESLTEDIVESWFDILKSDDLFLSHSIVDLAFYSKSLDKALLVTSDLSVDKININYFAMGIDDIIKNNHFDLILFDVVSNEDLDLFDQLLSYLSNLKVQPILIVRNHPSQINALKKIYVYDNLLGIQDYPSLHEFEKMISLIGQKKIDIDFRRIKFKDNNYKVLLDIDIEMTSLTENEITFKSKKELPFFSIIQTTKPFYMSFVIVPSYSKLNLSPNINGYHYMALIMGIDEKERQSLRRIVRYFLNELPAKWDGISLSSILSETNKKTEHKSIIHLEKSDESKLDPAGVSELVDVDVEVLSSGIVKRKKIGDKKSKL